MKRETRLYNVIVPIWIFMFWPSPPVFLVRKLQVQVGHPHGKN